MQANEISLGNLEIEDGHGGSVPGSRLFPVYINDLTYIADSTEVMMYQNECEAFFFSGTSEIVLK